MTNSATLITANAGCGKTWTLANRCIGWMVQRKRATGDADPAGLVAASFTRKAAGEILRRVLSHLAQSAIDKRAIEQYRSGFAVDPPPTCQEMVGVLEDLAAVLHRLQFGTLDGFYNRIATVFAGEIGLPAGWTIGDAPTLRAIHNRALDDLLEGCDQDTIDTIANEAEQEILKAKVHDILIPSVFGKNGGSGLIGLWRSTQRLTGDPSLWDRFGDLPDDVLSPGASRLSTKAHAQACQALAATPLPLNKGGVTTNKNWIAARAKLVDAAEAGRWEELLEHKLSWAALTGGMYSSHAVPEPLMAAIGPLLFDARARLVAMLRGKLRSWHLLVHALDLAVQRRQREVGAFSFQDVAHHLAAANFIEHSDRAWMQFRLDSEFRDLALDEFQDTSEAQFSVIRPIIEEILAGEGSHDPARSMLVVADPKQSIYGWRGGTPSLLKTLRKMGGDQLTLATLDKSYRSGPAIIGFVNDVFGSLASNTALRQVDHILVPDDTCAKCGLPELKGSSNPLDRALDNWPFDHHDTALENRPSAVLAWPAVTDDHNELQCIVKVIESRASKSGTMGVLVSTNKEVADIVAALREAGVDASEEGAGALSESAAVHDLLCLLRLGDHPEDRESAYDVSHSPLGQLVGLSPLESIPIDQQLARLSRVSCHIRRRTVDEGLEAFLVGLATAVEPVASARDRQALRHCIDLAATWRPTSTPRLDDFVMHVEHSSAGEPSGASVRVMTLHASKGLEFDEVLLPNLEGSVSGSSDSTCIEWAPADGAPTAIVVPTVREGLRRHVPIIELAQQRGWERNLGDRLSLLYVAVTRARCVLNIMLQSGKARGQTPSFASIIRAAIPELDGHVESDTVDQHGRFWMQSAADWDDDTRVRTSREDATTTTRPIRIQRTRPAPDTTQTPSAVDVGDRFAIWNSSARNRGTVLHELFRTIEWLDAGTPDQAARNEAFDHAAVIIGRPVSRRLQEQTQTDFLQALDGEAVAARLSREAYADWTVDALQVHREWPLLVRIDGRLIRGRIDRLVVGLRDGQIVAAEVIDFKSGRVDDAKAIVEHYRPQIEWYQTAIAAHFEIDQADIGGRLLFIDADLDLPCHSCPTAPSSS